MSVSASRITCYASSRSAGRRNPVLLVISAGYAVIAISTSMIFFAVLVRHSLPVVPSAAGFALMAGISVALGIASGRSERTGADDQESASAAGVPPERRWFSGVKMDLAALVMLGTCAGFMVRYYFEGRPNQADSLPNYFMYAWITLHRGVWTFVRWRR
jgi:hypothetical protein